MTNMLTSSHSIHVTMELFPLPVVVPGELICCSTSGEGSIIILANVVFASEIYVCNVVGVWNSPMLLPWSGRCVSFTPTLRLATFSSKNLPNFNGEKLTAAVCQNVTYATSILPFFCVMFHGKGLN